MNNKIILASKSPRRAEILQKNGVDFTVYVPDVEELTSCEDLRELPRRNAILKAAAAADKFPSCTIIGADTVIFFENSVLGKPSDKQDAVHILKSLAGKTHEVISGCAVICRDKNIEYSFSVASEVKFRQFDENTIKKYMSEVNVLDKAGAYAIQEHGDLIIEKFSGSLDNIIGLPADELLDILKKLQCL